MGTAVNLMKATDYDLFSQRWLKDRLPNDEARAAFVEIGHGMRLAIPRNGAGPAELIRDPRFPVVFYAHNISELAATLLIKSGLLAEMTEQTENCKLGWKDSPLPGEAFRLYVCIQ